MSIKRRIKSLFMSMLRILRKTKPIYIPVVEADYLKGKTALITGATSGIGLAIAKAFLNTGANVIVTGRNMTKITKTLEILQTQRGQGFIKGYVLDVSDVDNIKRSFESIINNLEDKRIDILVNNAGIMDGDAFGNTNSNDFTNTIDTNLKGCYFLSQFFSSYLIVHSIKGNILNICSSSSLRPAISPYMLSKWGIRALTIGMAKKLIKYGIVVNGIAPGPTITPMLVPENNRFIDNSKVPAGRYCTPEEIANFAVFLTSSFGRMVVGDIIYITGGSGLITFDDIDY